MASSRGVDDGDRGIGKAKALPQRSRSNTELGWSGVRDRQASGKNGVDMGWDGDGIAKIAGICQIEN